MRELLLNLELARRVELAEAQAAVECAEALGRFRPASGAAVRRVAGGFAVYCGKGSPITQAVGMGLDALGVADAHRDHRQHAVGADLGQSLRIHASIRWPDPAYRTASSRRPSTGPASAGGTRACPTPVTHGRIGFAVLVAIFVL